ncbi:MAG: hypothetical protein KJ050_10500 [Candidatus Omnitrophica bacterium]|nr:hypothetical protein [Candidatus Omnitrophota bacterium]
MIVQFQHQGVSCAMYRRDFRHLIRYACYREYLADDFDELAEDTIYPCEIVEVQRYDQKKAIKN